MKTIKILIFLSSLLMSVLANAADSSSSDPLEGMANLLEQEHQHPRNSSPPMSLAELESAALSGNPEIRLMSRRIAIVEAKARSAGSREDPAFMYRGWGTPLQRPWDLNQTQHMFMFNQALPGPGKRALRADVAGEQSEIAKAELEDEKLRSRRSGTKGVLRSAPQSRRIVAPRRAGRTRTTSTRASSHQVRGWQSAPTRCAQGTDCPHEIG